MDKEDKEFADNKGVLFSSGLIAGEALMGVAVAGIVVQNIRLHVIEIPPAWNGIMIFGYILILMVYVVLRDVIKDKGLLHLLRITPHVVRRCVEDVWKKK